MTHVRKNPTQLSKRNWRFYQRMELANMSKNAIAITGSDTTASTDRKNKGTTGSKLGGTKEGRSTGPIVEDSHKVTGARDGVLQARTEGNIYSVYGSVT